MMAGYGKPPPRYTLLVRKRDGMIRLTTATGARVPVAAYWLAHYSTGDGVYIVPVGEKGAFLFEDEFVSVEEFPVVEDGMGGSGEEGNTELVAVEQTPSLVA